MKNQSLLCSLAIFIVAATGHAKDPQSPVVVKTDSAADKAALSRDVVKTPPKFLTKGIGDPITNVSYGTKGIKIVTRASGATEEHPYVAVPLLFEVNSDELRPGTSRENVIKVAEILKELGTKGSTFAIEGHASAEGDPQRNLELSKLRATKIQALLREQSVPPATLARVDGFGSAHAQFKDPRAASESQLQQDRRVLVVREK